jgi:hypothetical protein
MPLGPARVKLGALTEGGLDDFNYGLAGVDVGNDLALA